MCVMYTDFGIVFDQGKGLGTPETVPFRLTRDMIDGMSVCICMRIYGVYCIRCVQDVYKRCMYISTMCIGYVFMSICI